jgi:tetratricopeptide (TPR) repeat protein
LTLVAWTYTGLKNIPGDIARIERGDIGLLYSGTSYINDKYWIHEPHRVLVLRALAEIEANRIESATAIMARAHDMMPGNVDLAVACVPALEGKGLGREADAVFQRAFAHQERLCLEFPRCGDFHNRLAWLAARCQRRLDQALEHAERAVRQQAKNVRYLHTLAEVHFQRGEGKRAIAAIDQAIALSPDDTRLQRQRQRIQAGDRKAPVPE